MKAMERPNGDGPAPAEALARRVLGEKRAAALRFEDAPAASYRADGGRIEVQHGESPRTPAEARRASAGASDQNWYCAERTKPSPTPRREPDLLPVSTYAATSVRAGLTNQAACRS